MRLKQLLGFIVPLLLLCTIAAAAGPGAQLSNVTVAPQGSSTVIKLQMTGSFTHNEYKPDEGLLLVDLTGVHPGAVMRQRDLEAPGVKSYRVLTYKGANGSEVTRLEISLVPGAEFKIAESKAGLEVTVKGVGSAVAAAKAPETKSAIEQKPAVKQAEVKPAPKPVETKQATAPKPVESKPAVKPVETKTAAAAKPAEPKAKPAEPKATTAVAHSAAITRVAVARGHNSSINIEIDGAKSANAMKLSAPDRIVVDVPNSVPSMRTRNIMVNLPEVKSVRVGRFQLDPPVTRVVVDLTEACDYQVEEHANGVRVKLQRTAVASKSALAPAKSEPVKPAAAKAEPTVLASAQPTAPQQKPAAQPWEQPSSKPVQQQTTQVAQAQPQPTQQAQLKPAQMQPAQQAQAQPAVFVEPVYKEKPASQPEQQPAERAAAAATTMAKANTPEPAPVPPANAAMRPTPAVNLALEQQQQQAAPTPAVRPKYTGDPISVNLKDVDLKDFFRLIHEISGLNVVLDPNVKGTLTLVLDDVPWDQALDIVLENNGLDRSLQGNVLRIATVDTLRREAEAKRAQAEAQALAVDKVTVTRFLSYARAKEVVPTIKRFLSQRGDVISDDRTNSLIIQDIPSVLPEVDRLLAQLDRKTQEVEIEARVVAATRNFAREIGTQLGFGWGNNVSAVGGAGAVGQTPTLVHVPSPQYFITGTDNTKPVAIPLFTNLAAASPTSGLSFSNANNTYRLDTILTMAESRGLLKILSRPRVVTQNNVQALVRQGVRIPIVTQAQLGGPPTVTYVDAFLRLTVTPQITAEGTIFLNVDVENTTPDFGQRIQGNPTLITQQTNTAVLVTDGGTVVIGGVIQTQNSVNTAQVPLLGDIPVFGNLFKRRSVSTSTQELIFFLSPKIIQT